MKIRNHLVGLLLLLSCIPAFGQNREHYFHFSIRQKSEIDRLTRIISIDNVRADTVWAYANDRQWEEFRRLGYAATELPPPAAQGEHRMSDALQGVLQWDTYPTYQGYLTMMRQYAANYPSICRLDTIGLSIQGRQILALKISDNVNLHEDQPQFLYTSSMHGDELVGYVLLLRLADYLLTQYGQATPEGERVTNLVNSMEIWINPLFNPDGTYRFGDDTTVSQATRGNANGVDLNRNFPDRIDDTSNTTAGREQETQVMMRWVKKHNFSMSANFHGGAQVVNYPWDNGTPSGTYSACPDDGWFVHISQTYATPNPDLMGGGFPNGITNGCDWYAIYGGRQDWIYWWHGGREVTIELYNVKTPSGSTLPQRWTNNKESFLAFMEEALKGIRGLVRDAETGEPLRARIDVQGISSVPVYSDSTVGDYHRLLLPGTYSIIAQVSGYLPDTLHNIVVPDSQAARADFLLHRSRQTLVQHVARDWNLVSLPLAPADAYRLSVYPTANSEAFFFDQTLGYLPQDTLRNGVGYWLRFPAEQNIAVTGVLRVQDSIQVVPGWNLIGSISSPVAAASVVQVPPGILEAGFFGYSGEYVTVDTLKPGGAYWVKVSQTGRLVLR